MKVGDIVKRRWPIFGLSTDDAIGIVTGSEKYDEYVVHLLRVLWATGELSSEMEEDLEVIGESG